MMVGAIVLFIVLPLVAIIGDFGIWKLLGKIVLGIVICLVLAGSGLFCYICFRAQARKWGAGLLVVVLLCLVAIYWLVMERLPFL